jgi:hypothetical protein
MLDIIHMLEYYFQWLKHICLKINSGISEYKNYGVTIKLSQVLCDPRPIQINERNDTCNIVESDEDNV